MPTPIVGKVALSQTNFLVGDLGDQSLIAALRHENRLLRSAISRIIYNLGNGSQVSWEADINFLAVDCPREVLAVVSRLRAEAKKEKNARKSKMGAKDLPESIMVG